MKEFIGTAELGVFIERHVGQCCRQSLVFAPVAQLDRAPGYEPGGRGFESLRAHQSINEPESSQGLYRTVGIKS